MSTWAYRCCSPEEARADWFVSQLDVERLRPDVQIVRVQVGAEWKCALLDRTQPVAVEDSLLRAVIASDEADCPQCAAMLAATFAPADDVLGDDDARPPAPSSAVNASSERSVTVQAAEISLQGHSFMVVVVPMSFVVSPGEADMAIEDLQPYFGGMPIVLMAQQEDGSPSYYGDHQLVEQMADIPIDTMLWKEYPVG